MYWVTLKVQVEDMVLVHLHGVFPHQACSDNEYDSIPLGTLIVCSSVVLQSCFVFSWPYGTLNDREVHQQWDGQGVENLSPWLAL